MLVECDRTLRDEDIVVSLFVNKELKEEPEYIVPFKEDIRYYLYPKKNEIYVETGDLNYLYSSFFIYTTSVNRMLITPVYLSSFPVSTAAG